LLNEFNGSILASQLVMVQLEQHSSETTRMMEVKPIEGKTVTDVIKQLNILKVASNVVVTIPTL